MLGFEPKKPKEKHLEMKTGKLSFEVQEEPSLLDIGLTEWLAQLARGGLDAGHQDRSRGSLRQRLLARRRATMHYRAGSTTGSVNLGRREDPCTSARARADGVRREQGGRP